MPQMPHVIYWYMTVLGVHHQTRPLAEIRIRKMLQLVRWISSPYEEEKASYYKHYNNLLFAIHFKVIATPSAIAFSKIVLVDS
jgi:hypothetical protein